MSKKLRWILAVALIGFCGIWLFESQLEFLIQKDLTQFPFFLIPDFAEKLQKLDSGEIHTIIKQIKFRWLILFGLTYFLVLEEKESRISKMTGTQALWVIRILVVLQLLYLPDLARELQIRSQWADLYYPLPVWKWILPFYLPEFFHQWAILLLFGIGAFSILKKWPADSPIWIIVLSFTLLIWTILLVQFFGFGKIDHTYSSLYAGMWGLILWLILHKLGSLEHKQGFRLFQAFIWGCYFFSGCEKLLFSGLDWISPGHFDLLHKLHPTEIGIWISSQPVLSSLLLIGALGFQLATPVQWRLPKWGYVNAAGAIVFHLGNWFIFEIGGWQSPWILMSLFLLPVWQSGISIPKK